MSSVQAVPQALCFVSTEERRKARDTRARRRTDHLGCPQHHLLMTNHSNGSGRQRYMPPEGGRLPEAKSVCASFLFPAALT